MITLVRDNLVMQVATEQQASVFERHGYKRIEDKPIPQTAVAAETTEAPVVADGEMEQSKPKRRRRAKKADE